MTLCKTEKEMLSSKGVPWLVPEEEKWKFVAEQVFLLMGDGWSMHHADTRGTVQGEKNKRAEKKFLFIFFLSCH